MFSRLPEFTIMRGSTICLECGTDVYDPDTGEGLKSTDTIYATFYQLDHKVIEYQINGTTDSGLPAVSGHLEIDEEDPTLLQIMMSQADTLKLETGEVLLQIRVKRGDFADTMVPVAGWVGPAYKEGSI